MKWASAISETTSLDSAIGECVTQIKKQLDDVPPELAVIFVSSHYESEYDQAVEMVREKLGSPRVFGCSGGGIIGAGQEVDDAPGGEQDVHLRLVNRKQALARIFQVPDLLHL